MDIDQIMKANEAAGQHFFDPGTMRFWRSRVSRQVYGTEDGGAYFVTSEAESGGPRRYTVRRFEPSGKIDSYSIFRAYGTLTQAQIAAHRAARKHFEPIPIDLCLDCHGSLHFEDRTGIKDTLDLISDAWPGYEIHYVAGAEPGCSSGACEGCGTTVQGDRYPNLAQRKRTNCSL